MGQFTHEYSERSRGSSKPPGTFRDVAPSTGLWAAAAGVAPQRFVM